MKVCELQVWTTKRKMLLLFNLVTKSTKSFKKEEIEFHLTYCICSIAQSVALHSTILHKHQMPTNFIWCKNFETASKMLLVRTSAESEWWEAKIYSSHRSNSFISKWLLLYICYVFPQNVPVKSRNMCSCGHWLHRRIVWTMTVWFDYYDWFIS